MQVFEDNSYSIGRTPLIRINRITDGAFATVYAKIEGRNPANSVKCRIGANMVWEAEKAGKLKKGMTIVEPTSGNTGIALAYVAAARGYKLIVIMPDSLSMERRKIMKALGANLILTDASKGMKAAIEKAKEIQESDPSKYFVPQQFENPANPDIHEKTTGPEIWNDTDGSIDILISGVGTGGTLTGVSRYIKKQKGKAITTVAVEPVDSPVISQTRAGQPLTPASHKIQGLGAGFVPKNLDLSLVDDVELISNEEAMEMARRLGSEEGILAGISSGAAMTAALRQSKKPENDGKVIVVVFPDSAERYLSTALFEGVFATIESAKASDSIL